MTAGVGAEPTTAISIWEGGRALVDICYPCQELTETRGRRLRRERNELQKRRHRETEDNGRRAAPHQPMSARPSAGPGDRPMPRGHKPRGNGGGGLCPRGIGRSLAAHARRHRLTRRDPHTLCASPFPRVSVFEARSVPSVPSLSRSPSPPSLMAREPDAR